MQRPGTKQLRRVVGSPAHTHGTGRRTCRNGSAATSASTWSVNAGEPCLFRLGFAWEAAAPVPASIRGALRGCDCEYSNGLQGAKNNERSLALLAGVRLPKQGTGSGRCHHRCACRFVRYLPPFLAHNAGDTRLSRVVSAAVRMPCRPCKSGCVAPLTAGAALGGGG